AGCAAGCSSTAAFTGGPAGASGHGTAVGDRPTARSRGATHASAGSDCRDALVGVGFLVVFERVLARSGHGSGTSPVRATSRACPHTGPTRGTGFLVLRLSEV